MEWIRTTDRLPEPGQTVLACYGYSGDRNYDVLHFGVGYEGRHYWTARDTERFEPPRWWAVLTDPDPIGELEPEGWH